MKERTGGKTTREHRITRDAWNCTVIAQNDRVGGPCWDGQVGGWRVVEIGALGREGWRARGWRRSGRGRRDD